MLQDLINTAVQELRLPEFIPDRCVHSLCETAQCHACVDSCPQDAWVLDDEQLGIIPERCDSCGLCVPACTEAAIKTELQPLNGVYRGIKISLAACSVELSSSSRKGILPCLHSLGIRDILSNYRRGYRTVLTQHSDCDLCTRGNITRIEKRIAQLNELLHQRGLQTVKIISLTKSRWLALRETLVNNNERPVSRRNFLRKAAAEIIDQNLSAHKEKNTSDTINPSPGTLLPTDRTADQQFCFPVIDPDKCNACHACLRLCPHEAIELQNKNKHGYTIKPDLCTNCQLCVDGCDQKAIQIMLWKIPLTRFIPLQKQTCVSCGVEYSIPLSKTKSVEKNKCIICSNSAHHSNLYQVLTLDENQ